MSRIVGEAVVFNSFGGTKENEACERVPPVEQVDIPVVHADENGCAAGTVEMPVPLATSGQLKPIEISRSAGEGNSETFEAEGNYEQAAVR